ncbi:MAG: hypothetical protein ACYCX9_09725 [Candidatus Dormibacteria bacterium]
MDVTLYVLTDRMTAEQAVLRYPKLDMEGDPDLCRRLQPFLTGPIAVVGGRRNPETGRRMTVLRTLAPGSVEWLEACLTRAAEDLRLDVDMQWS